MSAIVRTVGSVEHIPQCCCPVALDKGPSAPGSLAGDVRNLYWNLSQELYIIFYIKLKYFNTFFLINYVGSVFCNLSLFFIKFSLKNEAFFK